MFLSSLSIRRPILITMLIIGLVIVGLIGYSRLGLDLLPSFKIPYVTVTVSYPGAGPREVETKVTKVIEDAVATANNIEQVKSYSSEGVSTTSIEFQMGTDADIAAQDVRDRVSRVRTSLPDESEEPVVAKVDLAEMAILEIAVSGTLGQRDLRHLADNDIKSRLERVSGVASASVNGGLEREIRVAVEADRLQAYGLTLGQVVSAMAAENLNVPAGHIDEVGRRFTVRVPGEFQNPEEIRQVLLSTSAGPVHLSDLAEVLDTHKERSSIARLNGKEAVTLSITKLTDANIVQTADAARAAVAELNQALAPRAHLEIAFDSSTFAKESVADVKDNLLLGGLLAVVVVFLFLRNAAATLISAVALPTSVIASFGLMYFGGFTLNMMSMMALALAIGMLIDDAIVVIENIHRHAEEGADQVTAAREGAGEIAAAVTAITLTIVAVFAPIAFMGGLAGQIFREFGLTVVFAVLISLLVSLTLTPMLASRLLRRDRPRDPNRRPGLLDRLGKAYDGVDASYRPLLAWALRHRLIVLLGGIAIFIGSLSMMRLLGTEFIPSTDRGEFTATLTLPAGTALDETARVSAQVEKAVRARPEVERVLATIGAASGGGFHGGSGSGVDTTTVKVKLVPKDKRKVSTDEFMAGIREDLKKLPGVKASVMQTSMFGGGGESPVQITFQGPDVDQLVAIGKQATARLAGVPGLTDLDISLRPGQPEAQLQIDRTKATNLGVSVSQAATTVRTAVDGTIASQYRDGGDEYDIRVQLADRDRSRVAQLDGLRVTGASGASFPLREVADVVLTEGPTQITRTDKIRTVTATGNLLPGYALGNVMKEATKRVAGLALPSGYSVLYEGEAERMGETFGYIAFALMLAVVFVYMILAAQFESFLHPLTIGLSLPFAIVGAALALIVAGSTLNMMSMIGIVMLMGLVTKNAILLVDYTNTLRGRGLERNEAILRAGPTRLRPILMTTAAMVFGMLPVALGIGQGSEMRAPMAICVIGGLLSSMFLTLVLVPVVYTMLDDLSSRLHRRPREAASTE